MAGIVDAAEMTEAKIFRWLLDVGPCWPVTFPETIPFNSTPYWARQAASQTALSLLSPEERAKVMKFHRHTDAKLALGSILLKRRAISEHCMTKWSDVKVSQRSNGKPYFSQLEAEGLSLEFNVSHHGTIVALIGCADTGVSLGIDVVLVDWTKDQVSLSEDGLEKWLRTYDRIFSEREMRDMVEYSAPTLSLGHKDIIKAQLRHFYARWCLKEAYLKMTGDALNANWVQDLEFGNVIVPLPVSCKEPLIPRTPSNITVTLRDRKIENVHMELRALGEDYMIATAVSRRGVALDDFQMLDLMKDVYPV